MLAVLSRRTPGCAAGFITTGATTIQDYSLTLSGSGSNDQDFTTGQAAINFELGYFLTKQHGTERDFELFCLLNDPYYTRHTRPGSSGFSSPAGTRPISMDGSLAITSTP